MRSIIVRGIQTAILVFLMSVSAATADEAQASISITGRGEHTDSPDRAVISFAVETTSHQAAAAMAENANKSQSVTDAVKAAIGDRDHVTTAGFSLDPVYDHRRDRPPNSRPEITGYIARNQISVETSDTTGVGRLIDLAAQAGANRISGLHFTLEDRDKAQEQALRAATADAKRQAETIAASLGVRLGRVLRATTSQPGTITPNAYRGAGMAMEARAPTPIEPGEVRVEASILVTYAID